MKYILSVCTLLLISRAGNAQHTLQLAIKSKDSLQAMAGATAFIKSLNKTAIADSAGIATFSNLSKGSYNIVISYVGLEEQKITALIPSPGIELLQVFLEASANEEEAVIISTTRTSRNINDIPTRVETISGEELTEKGNMKPGDIRMLLNESTGIQTQQTSATSNNSSIRIQGLDGRYTQIIRDGFPLYSGFSGGLSLMQVAPLDLKQIEIIKGSSSTLYGGGAIAGLVNLISKTPTSKREINFLTNGTSAGGHDLSGFYSQRFNKTGITLFGSGNFSKPYDPAHIGLTAIPKYERYTINPKLFFYGNKNTASIGFSYINENRIGGSPDYIKSGVPGYFEKNNTDRFTTQFEFTHSINTYSQLNFKNSYSSFNRFIQIPSYAFKGLQQSTYSEITYSNHADKSQWVVGGNIITDDFTERKESNDALRNYHYNTFGLFAQNTWNISRLLTLETGLRADYVKQYGVELLPRISGLFKILPKLSARLGGGLGYKTPTVFNEDAEKLDFKNILPINESVTNNEHSIGGSVDVNYRTKIGNVGFTINQLFFYTKLNKPLVLDTIAANTYEFLNANGYTDTKGLETNVRFTYNDFKLFIGYTYADVNSHFNKTASWFPLTARHRLNSVLVYEKEGKLKIAAEAYFFSPQKLNDGAIGKSYWTFGLMCEKTWKHFSLFINLENITDTRQTRFDTIYTGPVTNPTFRDIYAPLDGFVVNGGMKIRL